MISAGIASLGNSSQGSAHTSLRRLYEEYPDRRDMIARAIAANPVGDDWPVLVETLQFAETTTQQLCLGALAELSHKPDKPEAYRTVIQTAAQAREKRGPGRDRPVAHVDGS